MVFTVILYSMYLLTPVTGNGGVYGDIVFHVSARVLRYSKIWYLPSLTASTSEATFAT